MKNNNLVILSEHNLQSSLMEQQLKSGWEGNVNICEEQQFRDYINKQQVDLILVDYGYYIYLNDKGLLSDFDQIETRFLLYNIPDHMLNVFFPQWVFLKGLLFQNSSVEQLVNCVQCILSDGLWFPRHYLERMIDHLRIHGQEDICVLSQLSNREKQILELVSQGKSNSGIAEKLFLSESTVKTHVYKIYKKLKVHKRQEVINIFKSSHHRVK